MESLNSGSGRDFSWKIAGQRHDGSLMFSSVGTKAEADVIYDSWKHNDYFVDAWYCKDGKRIGGDDGVDSN